MQSQVVGDTKTSMTLGIMNDKTDGDILLNEVVEFFSRTPLAPILSVPRVVDDETHPLQNRLHQQLEAFDQEHIEKIKNDAQFLNILASNPLDDNTLEREARIWALIEKLNLAIPSRRLELLRSQNRDARPSPYDHPALRNLEITDDFLVPLREFVVDGMALIHNGYAFTIAPSLESTNCQYWLLNALRRENVRNQCYVRLDPLMFRKEDRFPRLMYKMWWYGRPLDWNRIHILKEEEHGRWLPSKMSRTAQFTDFAWTPRDKEVHFQCEELPTLSDIATRGSRYFHAIYHTRRKRIIHLDGALRIFTERNWKRRESIHLRKSGKMGVRVKLFRIDVPLDRSVLGVLCSNYYVWNYDLARYFGADVPDFL